MESKQAKELREFDKKIIMKLDQQMKDQQSTLERAGVPGMHETDDRMNIKVQQRITPSTSASSSYELAYPMAIAVADDVNYRVVSSQFTFNNASCIIRNRLGSTALQIENANTSQILVDNIGSFTPSTGKVNLVGFLPTSVQNDGVLKIGVVPANESTIRPLRNYIIDVDTALLTIIPIIDFQNTESVVTT